MLFSLDADEANVRRAREARITALHERERLRPCLDAYNYEVAQYARAGHPEPYRAVMSGLTQIFTGTLNAVLQQIRLSGKTGIEAQNAIKRSAGTNFQGLCEYAILQWLKTTNLPILVGPNAPPSMKDEFTIYGYDADGGEFSVEPDIDICLWVEDGDPTSPIIFLSAKTSLVDRAGQAARWKLYLDMHQTACTHIQMVPDCPINRTRIKVQTRHRIKHCIVTANIYKMGTTQPQGELHSGQCRNNTYMFRHKYTTRNDLHEFRPPSWASFSEFPTLIEQTFRAYLDGRR